jgi:hypothetical protein
MDSLKQFNSNVRWTAAEKKVARRAFDKALGRHLSAITAEAKRMMANVAEPSELWQVEAYLTESRKTVDRIYQFRYSDLLLDPHAGCVVERGRPGWLATSKDRRHYTRRRKPAADAC